MLRKTLFLTMFASSTIIGWMLDLAPALLSGGQPTDILDAYEQAGIDVSACRSKGAVKLDPESGIPTCLKHGMHDIAAKLREGGL